MRRILVVDDNEDIRGALVAILEDAGYDVLEAGDGPRAVSVAISHLPDAVLLDLKLPPSGGFEVLREIRAVPALDRVPVIIVTGSVSEPDLRTARKLGAWDYITKPWSMGEVEARVGLALQGRASVQKRGIEQGRGMAPRSQGSTAAQVTGQLQAGSREAHGARA